MGMLRDCAAAAALLTATQAAAADPPAAGGKDAAAFGARERVQDVSLSPDGTRLAVLVPNGARATVLLVMPVGSTEMKPVLAAPGGSDQLKWCRWASDSRLVCGASIIRSVGDQLLGFTRTTTLSAAGGDARPLTARQDADAEGIMQNGGTPIDWLGDGDAGSGEGAVLMTRQFVPEGSTGSTIVSRSRGLGVERVDTATLSRRVVEAANPVAVEYITDGRGTVRIRGTRTQDARGYDTAVVTYDFRKPGSRYWQRLSRHDGEGGGGFNPYAVDRDLNVAYGFDTEGGRLALFRVALDGTNKRELVQAHPGVDVDRLLRIGRQNRVVGASFATERRESVFFDPELVRLQKALARALPKGSLIRFVDATADERKLLLWVGSDVDPGGYFLYNKDNRHLDEVLPARPELNGRTLASVEAVTFPAADGTPIPGYLTLPPGAARRGLPAIVMPHGGPEARDEWGFDWLAQFFAARGYAVLQPNFRGSSGYGAAWFQKNGFQSWRTAIGDVNDGARWLVSQGIADKAKLGIVGWSYGGYAALQGAATEPDLYRAVVAVAPVTDLDTLRGEARGFTSFAAVDRFIGRGPHVREGSPAQNAGRIKAPVLLVHGDLDQNVGVGESKLMASRLRKAGGKVELLLFKGLDHQLDDSAARAEMLNKADGLLRGAMGITAAP